MDSDKDSIFYYRTEKTVEIVDRKIGLVFCGLALLCYLYVIGFVLLIK
jgi:hypothetical protein